MTISSLPPETIRSITSEQVITSVDSLVKELVENAIDAGATTIDVRLTGSGITSISVKDNGSGIPIQDRPYVGKRHHTSKLPDGRFQNLSQVTTYGFRGEALNSICTACDAVTVITRTATDPIAKSYTLDRQGHQQSEKPVAAERGTTITAHKLFHRHPVRKETALRNANSMVKKVVELVQIYALIRPDIRFFFKSIDPVKSNKSGSKKTKGEDLKIADASTTINEWNRPACSTVSESIRYVLGSEVSTNLCSESIQTVVNADSDDEEELENPDDKQSNTNTNTITIEAHIPKPTSLPSSTMRSTSSHTFFYVNSRPVTLNSNPFKTLLANLRSRYINAIKRTKRDSSIPNNNNNNTEDPEHTDQDWTNLEKKFPFCVVNILLRGSYFDVNIEPSKNVVFFTDPTVIVECFNELLDRVYGETVLSVMQRKKRELVLSQSQRISQASQEDVVVVENVDNEEEEVDTNDSSSGIVFGSPPIVDEPDQEQSEQEEQEQEHEPEVEIESSQPESTQIESTQPSTLTQVTQLQVHNVLGIVNGQLTPITISKPASTVNSSVNNTQISQEPEPENQAPPVESSSKSSVSLLSSIANGSLDMAEWSKGLAAKVDLNSSTSSFSSKSSPSVVSRPVQKPITTATTTTGTTTSKQQSSLKQIPLIPSMFSNLDSLRRKQEQEQQQQQQQQQQKQQKQQKRDPSPPPIPPFLQSIHNTHTIASFNNDQTLLRQKYRQMRHQDPQRRKFSNSSIVKILFPLPKSETHDEIWCIRILRDLFIVDFLYLHEMVLFRTLMETFEIQPIAIPENEVLTIDVSVLDNEVAEFIWGLVNQDTRHDLGYLLADKRVLSNGIECFVDRNEEDNHVIISVTKLPSKKVSRAFGVKQIMDVFMKMFERRESYKSGMGLSAYRSNCIEGFFKSQAGRLANSKMEQIKLNGSVRVEGQKVCERFFNPLIRRVVKEGDDAWWEKSLGMDVCTGLNGKVAAMKIA